MENYPQLPEMEADRKKKKKEIGNGNYKMYKTDRLKKTDSK